VSLRHDAAVNAGANVLLAGLGIASGSFVAYRFGPEGRGVLGVGQVLVALGAGLGCLGLGDALVYHRASGAPVPRRRVAGYAVLGAVGAGAVGLLAGRVVATWLGGVAAAEFTIFATLAAGATGLSLVPLGAVRGEGRFALWNGARLVAGAWWLVSLVVTGASGEPHLVALGVVYASGVTATALVLLFATTGVPATATRPEPDVRRLLRFGIPSALASAPLLLNARIDQLALSPVATEAELGQYVAAVSYCWAVVPLGQAIANLATTRVAEREGPERVAMLRQLVGTGVTLIAVCGAGAWLAAGWAIGLLNGEGFDPAVGVARVLLIGASLQALTFICEEGAKGLGRPTVAMQAELTGMVVTAVALVVLVHHGLVPTAVASTIGYAAGFAVATAALSRAAATPVTVLLRPSMHAVRSLLARGRAGAPGAAVAEPVTSATLRDAMVEGPPDA
jgi:O-antigen/teichoic acid export membrane protein